MNREDTWQKLIELAVVTGNNPAGLWHLSFAHLRGAHLRGADLSEADLTGADLSEADLFGANLGEADLIGANLSKANLTGADLTGVHLSKANLSKANLSGANLSRAKIIGADLTGVNLRGADIRGADLSKAYLFRANLAQADLAQADLNGADLRGVNLSGANLSGADLAQADLSGADLAEANLNNAFFLDANLHKSMIKEANIMSVNFNSADLSGADITGAIFWGVSTTGWKIDGIKAEYIYFTRNIKDKEKHKKSFKEGHFEALFKTLPTIELIFDDVLNLRELYILNAILEDIKEHNPKFELSLKNTSVGPFQTSVGVTASQDEYLEKAAAMIREAVKNITLESLLPQITKMLPFQGVNESALKRYAQQPVTINQNLTINLNYCDTSMALLHKKD